MCRKYFKVVVVLLLLIECCFVFLSIKSFSNKNVTELKEISEVSKEMFSMYVENKEGEYEEYTDSEIFPIGLKYYFNEERSNCIDNKGNAVTDVLTYNNNKITVSSNKTLFCYLYFDLDKVAPQTFTFYLGGSTNPEYITSTSTTAYLSWTDTDITSYCINTENDSSSCSWTDTSGNEVSVSYTISTQGSQTRYAFIRDVAENISPVVSDEVFLDSVAPVITSASDSGAGTANVTVTETGSGVQYVCVNTSSSSTTGCTWDEVSGTTFTSKTIVPATANYYIHVKDKAGNIGHRTSAISITAPPMNLYTLCSSYSNVNVCTQNENLEDVEGIWNSTLEDDGYRYYGTAPENYICFGTTNKDTCVADTDKYMYRIIGIFEDSSGNQHIKLIKKESLNTAYAWYSSGDADVDWDESSLYKGINGSYFLTNTTYSYMQDSIWTNKIAFWNYTATSTKSYETYLNSGVYGLDYQRNTPKVIYLHELNRSIKTSQTCYYKTSTIADCTTGNWKEVFAQIGLMYASDYALSLGSLTTINNSTWIQISNNDSATLSTTLVEPPTLYEKTMAYNGVSSMGSSRYSYHVHSNGYVYMATTTFRTSVRPVFYLTSDVKITGGVGTSTDPYIIG